MQRLYSILCDDIRFEQYNKLSFIGVYSDGIFVPKLPFVFPKLCIAQEFDDTKNAQKMKLVLRGPKINLPPIGGEVKNVVGAERFRLKVPICIGPLEFEQEGDYFFETYFNDSEKPDFITKFFVRVRPKLEGLEAP
jgi:hypothetical protein